MDVVKNMLIKNHDSLLVYQNLLEMVVYFLVVINYKYQHVLASNTRCMC